MIFTIKILGSGAAIPTLKRANSAQLVNIGGRLFLIDCGEGTQLMLRKNQIRMQKIDAIFISHLHGDHFFGLVGLLSTLHLLGRKNELKIICHKPLKLIIELQLQTSETILGYEIDFVFPEKKIQKVYSNKNINVRSFQLNHSVPSMGFLFTENKKDLNISKIFIAQYKPETDIIKDIKSGADYITNKGEIILNKEITTKPKPIRSYAYCSDTAYMESLSELLKGVNLLYHEATFAQDLVDVAHKKLHSTAVEAATLASKAGVNTLLIGHFSARYKSTKILLEEAQSKFANTFAVEDDDEFIID